MQSKIVNAYIQNHEMAIEIFHPLLAGYIHSIMYLSYIYTTLKERLFNFLKNNVIKTLICIYVDGIEIEVLRTITLVTRQPQ